MLAALSASHAYAEDSSSLTDRLNSFADEMASSGSQDKNADRSPNGQLSCRAGNDTEPGESCQNQQKHVIQRHAFNATGKLTSSRDLTTCGTPTARHYK